MRKKILLFWVTILVLNSTFVFAQDAKSLFELGKSYWDKGKYSQAIKEFQKIVNVNPDGELTDDAQFWIGKSYYYQWDLKRAIIEYQKVIDKYPDRDLADDAQRWIGDCYYFGKKYEQATKEYQK